jgi:alpha-mannosidase
MDDRIVRARIEALRARAVVRSVPLGGFQARTALHTAVDAYTEDTAWADVTFPAAWQAGRTLFLRAQVTLPAPGAGERAYLAFDGRLLEGLLSVDGVPHAGVDGPHPRVPSPPAGPHLLEAEMTCVPEAFHTAAARRERASLAGAAWISVDAETEGLAWDAQYAGEASKAVRDARRAALLDSAVESALMAVDLTVDAGAFHAAVRAARALLRGCVGSIGHDPEDGRIVLTGHSHIDTAWLWPLRETVRKCGRTFSTALRLMERYPDYRFSCSQPQLYAYAKEHFPALFEQIKARVREGRWECTGGMWVEADCNVPSGESLIRQILHGIAFFREHFGKRPRTCWLPDVFGYPGSLPGLLAGSGITGFYTNKLHWQARNPFPAHLFRWEGIDGSSVTAHIPRLPEYYNGQPTPAQLRAAWDGFNEKAVHQELLFPFGHGDGGGGPTEGMLEMADRARGFPGLPGCRQAGEEEYFDAVSAAAPSLPTWTGELYLETHRGTYTTQSAIKRANRINENALRDAETWLSLSSWASLSRGDAGPAWARLHDAWETLLLLQFHDILPGSSIGEVYREALRSHDGITAAAADVTDGALQEMGAAAAGGAATPGAAGFLLFNSLSWSRSDPVTARSAFTGSSPEVVFEDGTTVPAQATADEPGAIVFVPRTLPGVGVRSFTVRAGTADADHVTASPGPGGGLVVENDVYRITLDAQGTITSLRDLQYDGREVVAEGQSANRLALFQDGPEIESAWNVHAVFEKRPYDWDALPAIRVVEQGPVRCVVRITRSFRGSRVEQDMVAWAGSRRIDFVTRVDWQARQVLLKACFPVAVRADSATFEVQMGSVRRPTHRNTSWDQEKFEVCAHRWMDLSEPFYGVSVLNDSRYGCDVHGSELRLTLLRGAEWPDPDADKGHHELTYALLPHGWDWAPWATVHRAAELATPVLCRPAGAGAPALPDGGRTFLEVHGHAVLSAVKRAENGDGWILRLYEPQGGRGPVTVAGPRPFASAACCNHVEEDGPPVPLTGGALVYQALPFQVRTFRVRF